MLADSGILYIDVGHALIYPYQTCVHLTDHTFQTFQDTIHTFCLEYIWSAENSQWKFVECISAIKVVDDHDSSESGICQNSLLACNLVNSTAPDIYVRVSSTLGIRRVSLISFSLCDFKAHN